MKINGFKQNEIFMLYEYLVAYEDSGIENYNRNKALFKEHPELTGLANTIKSVTCHKSNAQEMKEIDFKELLNEIYFTKNKGSNLLSFLSHLRNSIAHGAMVEHKGNVLITDFANPKYRPTDFTARGCVEKDIIIEFTKILNNIVL